MLPIEESPLHGGDESCPGPVLADEYRTIPGTPDSDRLTQIRDLNARSAIAGGTAVPLGGFWPCRGQRALQGDRQL